MAECVQFKRLTIAVELVANPSIIMMDEPTSGLDARAAQIVMRVVRNIVNSNRTIVCTIHQPSAEVFFNFDEVLLFVCFLMCLFTPDQAVHTHLSFTHTGAAAQARRLHDLLRQAF